MTVEAWVSREVERIACERMGWGRLARIAGWVSSPNAYVEPGACAVRLLMPAPSERIDSEDTPPRKHIE